MIEFNRCCLQNEKIMEPGVVALQRLPIKASADGFLFDGPDCRSAQEA